MVLDGHDGENAVEYAKMSLAGHLLSREIVGGPQEVADAIKKAFIETEKNFFLGMDDPIGRRLALKAEINVSFYLPMLLSSLFLFGFCSNGLPLRTTLQKYFLNRWRSCSDWTLKSKAGQQLCYLWFAITCKYLMIG